MADVNQDIQNGRERRTALQQAVVDVIEDYIGDFLADGDIAEEDRPGLRTILDVIQGWDDGLSQITNQHFKEAFIIEDHSLDELIIFLNNFGIELDQEMGGDTGDSVEYMANMVRHAFNHRLLTCANCGPTPVEEGEKT